MKNKLAYEAPAVVVLALVTEQVIASSPFEGEDENMFQDYWDWDV